MSVKPTDQSADEFVLQILDDKRRADCIELIRLLRTVTNHDPVMWGPDMVGFGEYQYAYPSGRLGIWFRLGFSPRKANLTLYFPSGFDNQADLLAKLGKHKLGQSCLYVKGLAELDLEILDEMMRRGWETKPLGSC